MVGENPAEGPAGFVNPRAGGLARGRRRGPSDYFRVRVLLGLDRFSEAVGLLDDMAARPDFPHLQSLKADVESSLRAEVALRNGDRKTGTPERCAGRSARGLHPPEDDPPGLLPDADRSDHLVAAEVVDIDLSRLRPLPFDAHERVPGVR